MSNIWVCASLSEKDIERLPSKLKHIYSIWNWTRRLDLLLTWPGNKPNRIHIIIQFRDSATNRKTHTNFHSTFTYTTNETEIREYASPSPCVCGENYFKVFKIQIKTNFGALIYASRPLQKRKDKKQRLTFKLKPKPSP